PAACRDPDRSRAADAAAELLRSCATPTVTSMLPVESTYVARSTAVQPRRPSTCAAAESAAALQAACRAIPSRRAASASSLLELIAAPDSWYGTAAGKILPARSARHRCAVSQAMIWRAWVAVKRRGSAWLTMPAAEAASPHRPSASATRVRPRRQPLTAVAACQDCAAAPSGRGTLPSPPGDSGCTVTPECYGLLCHHRAAGHLASPRSRRSQYTGRVGSTWLTQASTPPPTWTASAKPASLTTARISALRAPLLQCRTIRRSCGSRERASPVRNWSLGMSTAPGIETISYSFGSRTSTRKMSSSASSIAFSSAAVIVDPDAACWASADTVPQNAS